MHTLDDGVALEIIDVALVLVMTFCKVEDDCVTLTKKTIETCFFDV